MYVKDQKGTTALSLTKGQTPYAGKKNWVWLGVDYNAYEMKASAGELTDRFVGLQGELGLLVRNKGLRVAVYTQLTDVEHEVNGFLTYDRKVRKMDFARCKAAIQGVVSTRPA